MKNGRHGHATGIYRAVRLRFMLFEWQCLSVRFCTRRRANSEQQNNGLYFHGIEQLNLLCEFTIVQKRVFSQYNQHVH